MKTAKWMECCRNLTHWLAEHKVIFISYAAAFGLLLGVFWVYGVYPLGPNHILQIDASQEYAPRLNEFFRKLTTGGSLFYSWEGGLGNDFYFAFLTTMLNPFIYIGMLMGPTSITEVFTLMYLLQIPCCALTFAFYLKNKFYGRGVNTNVFTNVSMDVPANLFVVMFSLMYAFCAYVTAYFWVYYWLTGVMLLPLVAVGVDRIVTRKNARMYVLTLGLGIISNYMIGLFLCVFSVLYFLRHVITNSAGLKGLWEYLFEGGLKSRFCVFVAGSILAGGLAAFVIIPILISLPNTGFVSGDTTFSSMGLQIYFPFTNFLTAHYFKMTPSFVQGGPGLPNIYAGLLTLILLILYFAHPGFTKKEKFVHSIILLILYLFFSINTLDYLIHGFHFTSGAPHRFSFLYSFILLTMAFQTFQNIAEMPKRRLWITYAVIAIGTLFLFMRYPIIRIDKPGVFSQSAVLGNLLLLALYFILLQKKSQEDERNKYKSAVGKQSRPDTVKKFLPWVMAVVVVAETALNTHYNFNFYKEVPQRDLYVVQNYDNIQALKERTELEAAFYRMEEEPDRVYSDGKLYGYKGISIFSITYNPVILLCQKFGIISSVNKLEYRLSTPLLNSIFGVKYSLNRGSHQNYLPTYFNPVASEDIVTLGESPYALPIAYMVDSGLLEWRAEKEKTPFDFQDRFVEVTTGLTESLYSPPLPIQNIQQTLMTYTETGEGTFDYVADENIRPQDEMSVAFTFEAEEGGNYYLNAGGSDIKNYTVALGDGAAYSLTNGLTENNTDTCDINDVPPGTEVKVTYTIKNALQKKDLEDIARDNLAKQNLLSRLLSWFWDTGRLTADDVRQKGNFYIHLTRLMPDAFLKTYETLAKEPLNVDYYDDTTIRGNISVLRGEGLLFTTIPYDTRWHVYVNGQETEKFKVMDALLGVRLTQGDYQIEMKYVPQGITVSAAISLASLLIFILAAIVIPRIKAKREEPFATSRAGDDIL
ncbi:MAG: YfhO family protein [Clostridiales bacterium]|jgi:uncharacterized membrane protein YfhO|nr:YfhO family protein [Clostridiales bacterium]